MVEKTDNAKILKVLQDIKSNMNELKTDILEIKARMDKLENHHVKQLQNPEVITPSTKQVSVNEPESTKASKKRPKTSDNSKDDKKKSSKKSNKKAKKLKSD